MSPLQAAVPGEDRCRIPVAAQHKIFNINLEHVNTNISKVKKKNLPGNENSCLWTRDPEERGLHIHMSATFTRVSMSDQKAQRQIYVKESCKSVGPDGPVTDELDLQVPAHGR